MNINLFRLALERLKPSDWEVFEELASSFLVPEFSQLRTMILPCVMSLENEQKIKRQLLSARWDDLKRRFSQNNILFTRKGV
jgi:hypothetical protein